MTLSSLRPHGDRAPGIPGRSGDRIGIGGGILATLPRCSSSGRRLTILNAGQTSVTSSLTFAGPITSSLSPFLSIITTNSSPLHACCNFNSGSLGAPDALVGDARSGCGSGVLSTLPLPCATLLRPRLLSVAFAFPAASPVDDGVGSLESARNANSLVFSSEEANVAPISSGCRLP